MRYKYSWYFKGLVDPQQLLSDGDAPGGILFVHPTEVTMIEDYQRVYALVHVASVSESSEWIDAIKEFEVADTKNDRPTPADCRELLRLVRR